VNAERLEDAQVLATVEERERIARDLHDDLGQLLGYLTTKIQAARELVMSDRASLAADELLGLEETTRALSAQVREAILGLRTSVAPGEPLAQILESFAAEFAIQAGLRVTFTGAPEVGSGLPTATRYQVVRIAQEAMSNARRHARASEIVVELREDAGMLALTVRDDGTGFDPAAVEGTGRFGLKTMAERARAAGGTLEVVSAHGTGTTVRAKIPLGGA
jgi:signal transduction histidine kinase